MKGLLTENLKLSGKKILLRLDLNVPLKDHEDKIIGVLQLWNSTCPNTNKVIPFSDSIVELIESLTSQAAVALNNTKLFYSCLISDLKSITKSNSFSTDITLSVNGFVSLY